MLLRLIMSTAVRNVLAKFSAPICVASQLRRKSHSMSVAPFLGRSVSASRIYGGSGGGILHSFLAAFGQVNSIRRLHELYIKNLPDDATEEMLIEHFSQFGSLLSVRLLRHSDTMQLRGTCYVTFANKEEFDTAVAAAPHVIGSNVLQIHSNTRNEFLITDLSPTTTEKSLYDYFSSFGDIFRCKIRHIPDNNVHQAFVHFSHSSNLAVDLAAQNHVIDGKQVHVHRMLPRELSLQVNGLSPSTTEETLRAFYSQFGTLQQAEIKRDRRTGKSRGFAYICFSSQQELDNAISCVPHIIDGKEVDLDYSTGEFTIFVAELPPNTSADRLKEYFQQFGPVYKCSIAHDRQTNQPLFHGWVMFSSQKGVQNTLAARPHDIDGRKVDVAADKRQQGKFYTLFVGGLSHRTTDQMLYDAFSKFGSLVRYEVKRDRNSMKPRGFGYVSYASKHEVSKVLLSGPHVVDGRTVDVKR